MTQLILASGSPRRAEILKNLGYDFSVVLPTCDEDGVGHLPPAEQVTHLAERKARSVLTLHPDALVVGSDTLVYCDNQVLGKPEGFEDAVRMLGMLSGRTHTVYTGLCVCCGSETVLLAESAEVTFFPMTPSEIEWYAASGEPMDKAGAYAVQGLGSRFIQSIRGDFYTVMGLPAGLVYRAIEKLSKTMP